MILIPCLPAIRAAPPDVELASEEGKLGWVKFVMKWILFVLSFPFVVVFTWTIPNCSENRKWYRVAGSFLMSILWIAIISFAMVTIVARVGCILNVGEFPMGLVVMAIGTSVPVSGTCTLICAWLQSAVHWPSPPAIFDCLQWQWPVILMRACAFCQPCLINYIDAPVLLKLCSTQIVFYSSW